MDPELIADCVHCGFCLPSCPTYALWHEEMDSPRGRIHLMAALEDGSLELTDTVAEHFDRCLGCMACVTACPSGVQYDRLIELTRVEVERATAARSSERLLRAAMFAVLPHRRRLRAALALRRLPAPGPLGDAQAARAAVVLAGVAAGAPAGRAAPRVALVAGCVQSVVFGDVNSATARVLAAEGFDVHVPRAQGCCGALHAHAGRLERGRSRGRGRSRRRSRATTTSSPTPPAAARTSRTTASPTSSTSPSCSTERAAPSATRSRSRVAFQDSCHLRHAQRIVAQPRAMLASIPGLRLLEPAEQDLCCGSAGIYNLVQPQAARELGDRKAARVLETGADAYASANPGCLVQVSAALRRAGRPLPAFHPIELLDASIRGVDPDRLLEEARQ